MDILPVAEDEIVFVVADGYEIPSPVPILLRDLGEQARQSMAQMLYEAGIPYVIRGEFTDVDGVKQYAARGFGVGIIPRGCLMEKDNLRVLDFPQISVKVHLGIASYRKKFLLPELKYLIHWIEEELKKAMHG